jgi:hypothetical protein
MAATKLDGGKAGEHPLMSNRTLRAMYTGMVQARGLAGEGSTRGRERRAAIDDVACWASVLVGVGEGDLVFGCRPDGVVGRLAGGSEGPVIPGGVERLYAAVGAAAGLRGGRQGRVVTAFFERHEAGGAKWAKALKVGAEMPLVLVVLPRWKGTDGDADLCRESRGARVPGIAVDGRDAIALYRVASESLGRARAGGGAALIAAVEFRVGGRGSKPEADAVVEFAAALERRGVATRVWLARAGGDASGSRSKNGG